MSPLPLELSPACQPHNGNCCLGLKHILGCQHEPCVWKWIRGPRDPRWAKHGDTFPSSSLQGVPSPDPGGLFSIINRPGTAPRPGAV